jgi:hypothetical protein
MGAGRRTSAEGRRTGLHCGYIAADMAWPSLLSLLRTQAGEFTDLGVVENPAPPAPEGYLLWAGEHEGQTYLLDPHLALSTNPDLIAFLSAEGHSTVVGHGAETTVGSYWFIAARGGTLLRHYHSCGDAGPGFTHPIEPFDRGAPFPSEAEHPLDDGPGVEGQGQALGLLGLHVNPAWFEGGPSRAVLFNEAVVPPPGPLAEAENAHFRQFLRPAVPQATGWLRRLFRRPAR